MQCRDLASTGNYVGPGETIIGNQACHPVQVAGSTQLLAQPAANTAPAAATPDPIQSRPVVRCVVLKRMGPADQITSQIAPNGGVDSSSAS